MAINLFKMQDMLKNMSKDQLVAEAQNPTGTAPAFMVHARLAEVSEQEKEASRNASAADTTTVAQDVVQGAGIGGIGAMSQAFNPRAQNSADNGAFDPRTVQDTTGRPAEPVRMAHGGEIGGETRGRPAEPIRMAPGGEVGRAPSMMQYVDPLTQPGVPSGSGVFPSWGSIMEGAYDRTRASQFRRPLQPHAPYGGMPDDTPIQTGAPARARGRADVVDGVVYELMPDGAVFNASTGQPASADVADRVRAKLLDPRLWSGPDQGAAPTSDVLDVRLPPADAGAQMQIPTLAPPADTQDQYANRTIGGPSDFQQAPSSLVSPFGVAYARKDGNDVGITSLPDMSRPAADMSYPTESTLYPPQIADGVPPPMPSVERNGGNPSYVETTAENEVFAPLNQVGPANEMFLNGVYGGGSGGSAGIFGDAPPLRGPAGSAVSNVEAPYTWGSDTVGNFADIMRTTAAGGFQWLDGYAGHDTYGPAGMPIEDGAPVGPLGPAGPAVDTPDATTPTGPVGPSAPAGPRGPGGIAGAAPATAGGALSAYDQMLADALSENESDRAQAKWLMLAEIGAGMLGSTQPGFAGTGQAISAGLGSYTDAKDALKAEAMGIAGLAEDQRRYEQNRVDQFALASMSRSGSSGPDPMNASMLRIYMDQADEANTAYAEAQADAAAHADSQWWWQDNPYPGAVALDTAATAARNANAIVAAERNRHLGTTPTAVTGEPPIDARAPQ